jgi:PAS domain S-box-containing protein
MHAASSRPASSSTAQASLLLVDDNPAHLLVLEGILEPLRQRLVRASSGGEALRRVLDEDFAAILLDIRLGDMSGVEVLALLRERERNRRTPVLLLTAADGDERAVVAAYKQGAVDYLRKPVIPDVLRAKVSVFVELFLAREAVRRHEEAERARERAELRLANQEMLHHLLAQAPAGIAITRGPEFIFEFTNPLYEKLVGRPIPLGKPLREVLPEVLSQPQVMAALQHVMETGESFQGTEFLVALDRRGTGTPEEAYFNLIYQPTRDVNGEVSGLLTFAIEVTEWVRARRKAEELAGHLRDQKAVASESEERLRLAVTATDLGTWDLDLKTGQLRWDTRCKALFGLPPDADITYDVFLSGLHPEDRERTHQAVQRSQDPAGTGGFDLEYRTVGLRDGVERWCRATGRTYFVAGHPARFVGTIQDVTEHKRAEQERARLYEEVRQLNADLEHRVRERTSQLQELNQELESFSYSVSHDLRAPLRHITGFGQLLERRAGASLDEPSRELVKTIVSAAKQGDTLVDALLAFSRMGRAELRQTRVDLGALAEEVRRELQVDAAGREVEWRMGPLPAVTADPALLRQVLRNLLGNALKYSRPRPRAVIEVGAQEKGNEVEVWVRDNGVGFDMRFADKLFGPFQRLHTAEEFEGSGIGLANVRRIISRHGGRTWAEGQVDRGTTVFFSLPQSQK